MTSLLLALAAVAAACWMLTVYKLRDLLRDPGNRALRHLCLTLAAFSLSMTVQPVAAWLDRAVGVLDTGRVTANCLVLVGATAAQGVLLHLAGPEHEARRRMRRRFAAMLAAIALIVAMFLSTPAPYRLDDPYVRSLAYYAATPTPAAAPYTFVFLAVLVWAALQGTALAHRYARVAPRPLLALGLRLITAGAALGLGYVVIKLVAMVGAAWHPPVARALDPLIPPWYATATMTLLIGSTIPSWGPRIGLERAWGRLTARRDCRRLQPLWELIHATVPQVTLLPHPEPAPLRRVRLTVEILDGYVQLAPWTSTRTAKLAARRAARAALPAADRDPTIEAAVVAAAARARLAGRPADADAPVTIPLEVAGADGARAGAQVAWLSRVAHALGHCPAVSATLAELEPGGAGGGPGGHGSPGGRTVRWNPADRSGARRHG